MFVFDDMEYVPNWCGYTVPWAINYDDEGRFWLRWDDFEDKPGGTLVMRIEPVDDHGYIVSLMSSRSSFRTAHKIKGDFDKTVEQWARNGHYFPISGNVLIEDEEGKIAGEFVIEDGEPVVRMGVS